MEQQQSKLADFTDNLSTLFLLGLSKKIDQEISPMPSHQSSVIYEQTARNGAPNELHRAGTELKPQSTMVAGVSDKTVYIGGAFVLLILGATFFMARR